MSRWQPAVQASADVELPAVRDRDLRGILIGYGLAERMDAREATCASCSQTLTWDSIGALLVRENGITLFCNLSECIDEAAATAR